MDVVENRKICYAYIEKAFPIHPTFRLMCGLEETPSRRRTAMTAPARAHGWVQGWDANTPHELHATLTGRKELRSGSLAMGTAIHLGPISAPPPLLFENPSAFEDARLPTKTEEVWRDFVIDLDLDEYDNEAKMAVRFCACAGEKKSCPICWCYIQAAHAFLTHRLRDRFGIQPDEALWVKSGNKGAHCWVGSPRMARIRFNLRKAVVNQLVSLPKSLETEADKADFRILVNKALSPLLSDKLRDLRFRKVLMRVIGDEFGILAGNIPDEVRTALDLYRWLRRQQGPAWTNRVKLHLLKAFAKPRYDKGVVVDSIHCAKVPFSVNATTLRVSIPICDIRNPKKPPLASQVAANPSLITPEIALFEKWVRAYLG